MAAFLDRIQQLLGSFGKKSSGGTGFTEKEMLANFCYIGDMEGLKKQGTKFILPVGLVVSKYVRFGKNCILYQNVTIGGKDFPNHPGNPVHYPQIGDNVIIYPGACILGPVKIGSNSVIGANTVVVSNVPDNSMVSGNPAKIIPKK